MKKISITIILMLAATTFALRALPATEFHVSITGNDANPGTQAAPLRTIQRAADLAQPGDTVTVHAGVYREYVNPPRGGESDTKRIVYQAVAGEKVVITGSEEVKNWEKVQDGVWKATIPNTFFGSFNPFTELIAGDWFDDQGRSHHAGAVYLNGDWLTEAVSREEVMKPITETPLWFASVDTTHTVIWAQFMDIDPNAQQVEVNVRRSVFYPDKPGRNFITVRGFTLCNAATPWAPPTVEQIGLIGVHWSKGWIIENNDITYSTCSGITLGKYGEDKDHNTGSASGYVTTIERALKNGWNKETIGHHVVRNNHIAHCEQAGIVGSLGAAFSTIIGNTIHDIHVRQLFSGAEMAGIKFHGPIDATISGNHIYRTCRGIWLDWMTQGTRISNNLCHDNQAHDLMVEANHGPFVVDNNIFLSPKAIEDPSQGGAYAHNLIAGGIDLAPDFFDGRKTPFHKAHSTEVVALHDNPSGDSHYYNNLFMGSGSLEKYDQAHLPMWMDGNVFFQGTQSSKHESAPINRPASDPGLTLVEKNDGFYLTMTLAAALGSERPSQPVTSSRLGKASISGCAFENPDGSPIAIGTDYFGRPRNAANPTPGPFEAPGTGTLTMKVWPLAVLPAYSEVPYLIGRGTTYQPFTWDTTCPPGCPFSASSFRRLQFTGRWATYTAADTFYPTWGGDDVLYSPWTDGSIGTFATASPSPGQCSIEGNDPLYLTIGNVSSIKGNGAGYGLYPCGSLMYNDIWYYSSYLLTWTDPDAPQDMPDWGVLEPWVGFRHSSDKGLTWTDPTDSAIPLLEPHHNAGKGGKEIMIGAPHFVDFGKNMQHAPVESGTGRKFAYMVAHGADPGIQIAAHNSWIQGDNIYLIRILMPDGTNATENAAYLNTHTNWQYYARNGEWKNWDKNNLADVYGNIQAIAHWSQRLGNVSMTYNAVLGKYLMVMSRVVTGNKDIMDGMLLESDAITGPFRLVQYLPSFGSRAYFLNIPSKFISADGLTMWLGFSANYWWYTSPSFPGATYAWCLREFKLSTDPNPIYLSGKIEAESGSKVNGAEDSSDPFASGGYNVASMGGVEFTGLAKAESLTIRYAAVNEGTFSLYINGTHAKDITVHSTGAWHGDGAYTNAVVDVAVPDGASLRLQKDSGDVGINLDYITLTFPGSVRDIRTSGQGGGNNDSSSDTKR